MRAEEMGRLLTAMVTPFDADLKVDWDGVARLAGHLTDSGSDGIVVAGTTGESPTLTNEEKVELFRVVRRSVAERVKVIAGTGNYCTAESVELTKEAEAVGVDGVMLVCPYYNKPSQDGLYRHFRTVAEETSLPVILYNIPARTGKNIEPKTILRLAEDVKNIVGVKEASGDMKQVAEIASRAPEEFGIWSGNDEDTLHILALGGLGVISVASHVCGNEIKQMIEAFQKGDTETARKIHLNLMPFIKALFPPTTPNPVPIKCACNLVGLSVGGVRLPLVEATEQEAEAVRKELVRLGKMNL